MLGVLHQLGRGSDGIDPRAGEDRGDALQVRLGNRDEPVAATRIGGRAARRRDGLGTGLVHARVRRVRRGDQIRRQDAPGRQDGDPQHRPSRHRRVHQLQGGRGAQGLGLDRRRVRRLVQRRRLRIRVLPELEQQRPGHRRVHAGSRRRRRVGDARGDRRAGDRHASGARAARGNRRGNARVRRPGRAVRHDDQRLAHVPVDRPDQRVEPVLGVHVPRRLGLQPRLAQPDALRAQRQARHDRYRALRERGEDDDHRPGDSGRWRGLPDAQDRAKQPRLPTAGARLREPGRPADGGRNAVRQHRRPAAGRARDRADDRSGLRPVGAHRPATAADRSPATCETSPRSCA